MCRATRYPDAIPVSSTASRKPIPRLMDAFSKFGVPRVVHTDQGNNITEGLLKQIMSKMGIKHVASSPYHPKSQGCLERLHRTLKSVLTKYAFENDRDWDEGIQIALCATRSARKESLGYSPYELMFGRKPRENLRILYEVCVEEGETEKLAGYVVKMRKRIECARRLASENLETVQAKIKITYDKRAVEKTFEPGDYL